MNQGLTDKEVTQFKELCIKANFEQITKMVEHIVKVKLEHERSIKF